jgi:hypothetical protein
MVASDQFNPNTLEHCNSQVRSVDKDPRSLRVFRRLQELGLIHHAVVPKARSKNQVSIPEPLIITQRNEILRGFEQRDQAISESRETVWCLEIEFETEEEVICWLLSQRERLPFLNAFSRVALALSYAAEIAERGRLNQRLGGKLKHLTNLSNASVANTRREIAKLAGVSEGNVRKAKAILDKGIESVIAAVHRGEVSIHRAFAWLNQNQAALLSEHRLQSIRNTFHPATKRTRAIRKLKSDSAPKLMKYLEAINEDQDTELSIFRLDLPGKSIIVSKEICDEAQLTDDGGICES